MESVKNFFSDHWKVMLIGLAGVFLGVFLNSMFGDMKNRRFLNMLEEELEKLEDKERSLSLTPQERGQIEKLRSEIYILKFRCLA